MSCQLPPGSKRGPDTDPCLPGNVATGCVATIRFQLDSIPGAGGQAVVEVERPAGAEMAQLLDIVASRFEVDAAGASFVQIVAVEDDEGRNYLPKVGSDSEPGTATSALGQDVPIDLGECTRAEYSGNGSGVSNTPFANMTLPKLRDRTDKFRVKFQNNNPAATENVLGEFKVHVLAGSKKNNG